MTEVVDFPVKPETRDYLARFARDAGEPLWLVSRRQQAMTRFAELERRGYGTFADHLDGDRPDAE